uniref:MORN repeat-containing protein n=1 Tax=viral metagenome TaxID=1070528 RepID=A0A6C0EDE6_9ZZZZ
MDVYASVNFLWIVVMEPTFDCLNDENRTDIYSPSHAKYRGTKFMVKKIMHKIDNTVIRSMRDNETGNTFTVGEVVINNINPIIYYKSVSVAYCVGLGRREARYTGQINSWRDNGEPYAEFQLVKGTIEGICRYYIDDTVCSEVEFKNGMADGFCIQKYKTGETCSTGYFMKGEKFGDWNTYDKKGNVVKIEKYHDGHIINTLVCVNL